VEFSQTLVWCGRIGRCQLWAALPHSDFWTDCKRRSVCDTAKHIQITI